MDITLNYSDDTKHLAYSNVGRENATLQFDSLEICLNELLVKFDVCAEVSLHEINEAVIADTIREALNRTRFGVTIRNIAHNLNAESLGEYEKLSPIGTLMVYRNSDRLADIEGRRHKVILRTIRKSVYKIA